MFKFFKALAKLADFIDKILDAVDAYRQPGKSTKED